MSKQQKITLPIRKKWKPKERLQIASDIIEFIKHRTVKKSLDRKNRSFPKYEKEYAISKGSSKVNLLLSTEMLANLKVLKTKKGSVTIGYEKGSNINGKAEGNITGSYGQPSPNRKKARDFLGINATDKKNIQDEQ